MPKGMKGFQPKKNLEKEEMTVVKAKKPMKAPGKSVIGAGKMLRSKENKKVMTPAARKNMMRASGFAK